MPAKSMPPADLRGLPSVDAVLRTGTAAAALDRFGRQALIGAIRATLAAARNDRNGLINAEGAATVALARLQRDQSSRLRSVYNLTGTILHTNLGRALIADSAIEAATAAMRNHGSLGIRSGKGAPRRS